MSDNKSVKLTTPEAEVLFAVLKTPKKGDYDTEPMYSMRVKISGQTKGALEFKTKLQDINEALVVTKVKNKDGSTTKLENGDYIINARSRDPVNVFDEGLNKLTQPEIPMISSGTVQLVLTSFEGKDKKGNKASGKGGINLNAVLLIKVEEHKGNQMDDDEIRDLFLKAKSN